MCTTQVHCTHVHRHRNHRRKRIPSMQEKRYSQTPIYWRMTRHLQPAEQKLHGFWCKFRFPGFSRQITPLISLNYVVAVYAQKQACTRAVDIRRAVSSLRACEVNSWSNSVMRWFRERHSSRMSSINFRTRVPRVISLSCFNVAVRYRSRACGPLGAVSLRSNKNARRHYQRMARPVCKWFF
jgi:hypothetical protein